MALLIALFAFGATLAASLAVLILRPRVLVAPGRVAVDVLGRVSAWATPDVAEERHSVVSALTQAGFGASAMPIYLGLRGIVSAFVPILALLLFRPDGFLGALVLAVAGATFGYLAPWQFLRLRRDRRQAALRSATPAALDLLITCLDAGLALEAALGRVARELRGVAPAMSDEFEHLLRDLSAGVPRHEALRDLPRRTGVEELGTLADALVRAERGGLGIVAALREFARELRTLQILDAERRAAAAGPTLTVAMIVFVLPLFLVVIVGPAVMQVARTLQGP